jgi:cytochrome c-type biogenesis protein CcmE
VKAQKKFVIGSGIIVATLVALAYVGYTQSKTYYHTISELPTLTGATLHQRMRVSGNVKAGSITHPDGRIDFVLEEEGKTLPVKYVGNDPLPDTFKDGAQALVEGHVTTDGFVAEQVQAKCASKYEASPLGTPGAPSQPASQPGQSMNQSAPSPSADSSRGKS